MGQDGKVVSELEQSIERRADIINYTLARGQRPTLAQFQDFKVLVDLYLDLTAGL